MITTLFLAAVLSRGAAIPADAKVVPLDQVLKAPAEYPKSPVVVDVPQG